MFTVIRFILNDEYHVKVKTTLFTLTGIVSMGETVYANYLVN